MMIFVNVEDTTQLIYNLFKEGLSQAPVLATVAAAVSKCPESP